jgi:hypothetical protein
MANATFDLDRLEAGDDAIVVSGHWNGVRGMRFVRPTLTVAGRRLLATLEHKPWAPDGADPWTAAFPWSGDAVDAAECWLDVAPGVLVPLAPGTEPVVEVDEIAQERERFQRRETEVDYLRGELRRVTGERDRALDQRDEAVRDREAAMRTRERMEAQRDDAAGVAERARDAAAAAEDACVQARAQRDDALGAYRALQDQLRAVRAREGAREDEARPAAPKRAAPKPTAPQPTASQQTDREQPIGVRAIPAARAEGVLRPRDYQLTSFDLYAFRIVGGLAAASFVVLMIALLKVFI